MRGPIAYIGGKRAIAKQIIEIFPKHTTYVEAFAGGAQVFFHKEPSKVEATSGHKSLVVFSDMRQCTRDLNLETSNVVPSFLRQRNNFGLMPNFHEVDVFVLGADGAGKSSTYWRSLQMYWKNYLTATGAVLQTFSVLQELPVSHLPTRSR